MPGPNVLFVPWASDKTCVAVAQWPDEDPFPPTLWRKPPEDEWRNCVVYCLAAMVQSKDVHPSVRAMLDDVMPRRSAFQRAERERN